MHNIARGVQRVKGPPRASIKGNDFEGEHREKNTSLIRGNNLEGEHRGRTQL